MSEACCHLNLILNPNICNFCTSGSSGDAAGKTGCSPLGGPYLWAVKPHLYFVIVILCILLGKINDIYINWKSVRSYDMTWLQLTESPNTPKDACHKGQNKRQYFLGRFLIQSFKLVLRGYVISD